MRKHFNLISQLLSRALPDECLCAFHKLYFLKEIIDIVSLSESPLIAFSRKNSVLAGTLLLLFVAGAARAQSGAAEGQKLAFDRGKGNCLTCHQIKGGDLAGTIGPPLQDIKSKYPDRNELVAIITDETKRNPQTMMPPFGRNRILTEQEINAIVDFLQTL